MATLSLPKKLTGVEKHALEVAAALVIRDDKVKDCKQWLVTFYPAFAKCLPLVIGAHKQTISDCPKGISKTTLNRARVLWCGSQRYLEALAKDGSMRHNLDGTVAGPVSELHREMARKTLAERKAENE